MEPFPLHGGVRVEHHIQLISGGDHLRRYLDAAEPPQAICVVVGPIEDFDVVVGTFLVLLQLEVLENDLDPVSVYRGEVPHAVLPARVEVGPVRTANLACWRRDLVLTAALFTVELVLVQRESVVTCALVASDRVLAYVLAAAIIYSAFIFV